MNSSRATLATIDAAAIQVAVNRIAARPTDRLAGFISLFCRERFLWDYSDDGKLLVRLNQVMRRVRLPQLPDSFGELLPAMRSTIRRRQTELLDQANAATH